MEVDKNVPGRHSKPEPASGQFQNSVFIPDSTYFYVFQAMFFDRDDIALPGFSKFFKKSSDEERCHAEKFMKYQNKRGGRIVLQNIQVIFKFLKNGNSNLAF